MTKEAPSKIPQEPAKKWLADIFYTLGLATFVFAGVVGAEFLVGYLANLILPRNILSSPLTNALASLVAYLIAIMLIIWLPPKIFKKIKKPSRERLGIMGLPTWTDIGLSPVGYIVAIVIAMGITAIFNNFPWFNGNETQELGFSIYMMGWERGIAFLALVIIAPLAEELIFRGWLYGHLRIKIPKTIAIIVTSLVFAVVHMQWNVGITVFAMSIVNCVLREITGTIYAGTLVHMINNGVAFYLVYIAVIA